MCDLHNAYTAAFRLVQKLKELAYPCRVKACCRLIQNEIVRTHCVYGGERDTATLPSKGASRQPFDRDGGRRTRFPQAVNEREESFTLPETL